MSEYLDIENEVIYRVQALSLKETVHLTSEILLDAVGRTNDKRTKKYLEILANDVARMESEVRE